MSEAAWYCVRTAPKHEARVAALLQREMNLEVFAPKIRFRRSRMGRSMWVTEALFPGYLFARFVYFTSYRQIRAMPGVSTIVHFGERPAVVPEDVVALLRANVSDTETLEIAPLPEPGSEVLLISGPLRGLQLLVTRVMSARQRIAVLLEMLGMQREIEVAADSVIPARPRAASSAPHFRRG